MANLLQHNAVDNIADGIWLTLLTFGTIFGCWMFCQIPYGGYPLDDYAVIIFRVMTGVTFGFVLSGLIAIPLREVMKPLICNLHKRALEIRPRLLRALSI